MKLGSRRRTVLATASLATLAVGLLGAAHAPDLVVWAMTPAPPFDPAAVPPAPDYANDAAWLALPTTADEADVTLSPEPAGDAAVFYLHPTSSVAPA